MPYTLHAPFSTILFLGLVLTSFPVLSTDLTDLYPEDGNTTALESTDATAEPADKDLGSFKQELTDVVDSIESESSAISSILQADVPSGMLKDVVMVLDNSGSMKKNDPDFLATRAVSEFISSLDTQTRIAIVIFDQDISLAVPLTILSADTREKVVSSLKKVNYKGLFTDSPAAIERAIYELKNNGREGAQKSIVFMTDGIVDTGKADIDLEKSKWLKEDLAADAADESIKIFGVAFTEAADFQLIQSVSQKTDGEYYRALQASDLQKVFMQINEIINRPPEVIDAGPPDTLQQPEPVQAPVPAVQQPMIIEVPVQPASMSKEERIRSTIVIVAAAIVFITLLAIVFLLLKRSREVNRAANEVVSEAFINDIHNYTGTGQYQLGQKPTMFGRVAGKDTEHLNYLVIPESTIGRRHALIEYKDFGFWISDQGSINGTFVNDQIINSEVCLKHGDKVRLHKFEFEFIMPEMDDSSATVMSNTQFAGQANNAVAATVLKGSSVPVNEVPDMDPEFDITGSVAAEPEPEFNLEMGEDDDDEETLIRGDNSSGNMGDETDHGDEDEDETVIRGEGDSAARESQPDALVEDVDGEDETLMPGSFGLQEDQAGGTEHENAVSAEDETLMRGNFDAVEDDEMTIRKEADEALEDFFDLEKENEEDKNK